jgi:hypothetical protein
MATSGNLKTTRKSIPASFRHSSAVAASRSDAVAARVLNQLRVHADHADKTIFRSLRLRHDPENRNCPNVRRPIHAPSSALREFEQEEKAS